MVDESGTFEYEEVSGGIRITRYTGGAESLRVPETIGGRPVRELGEYAFYEEDGKLRRAVVPGTVKTVGSHAFAMCSYLEELVLEEGVEELQEAFAQSTAVRKIRIPASVKVIEAPEEIEAALEVDDGNPLFKADGFGLYAVETESSGLKEEEQGSHPQKKEQGGLRLLCVDPEAERDHYQVAEGTAAIEKYAFHSNGHLKSVDLPVSVKEIPEGALSGSKRTGGAGEGIEEIKVNGWQQDALLFVWDGCLYKRLGTDPMDGIELIYAFRKRRMLTLPRDVAVIDEFALTNCGAEVLTITSERVDIHRNAFRGCPLREIYLVTGTREEEGDPLRILFPTSASHLREDLMEGFGTGRGFYDFTAYDRTLAEAYLSRERIDMILNRLEHPDGMMIGVKEKLLSRIHDEWEKVIDIIVKEDDRDAAAAICDQNILTPDELDEWIRRLSEFGEGFGTSAKDKMVIFISYKHAKFGKEQHDYSL